jgi:5-carboxymethyl-2-hydroxymuconate isomerase
MPHLVFEITDNIAPQADIDGLLKKANDCLIAQGGVFPIGGIRSRAIVLQHYRVADGAEDDAFVHVTLKVGAGRTAAALRKAGDELFAMIKDHFAALQAARGLALSMEIFEFDEAGTWKHNNIHARYRKT